jgi:murein DD-endopeptidase MepM/ murein hydrolase activator NlpD
VAVVVAVLLVGLGVGLRRFRSLPPQVAVSLAPSVHAAAPSRPSASSAADTLALLTSKPTKLSEVDSELWLHPLYGPRRVLPVRNTRRFGAAREGLRPEECRDGHCGVDLGTAKGDPVIAVHDGVVERVVRDAEEGGRRGNEGRFIRKIRGDLHPGVPVKAGEQIGTVGETGVQHSGPHLHFAISVRRDPDSEELFIDPEPMLHLWTLKDPPPQAPVGRARRLASR